MPYHTANTAAGTLGNKAESTWLFAWGEPSFGRPHPGREPEEEEE